jgi:hypothetical protein
MQGPGMNMAPFPSSVEEGQRSFSLKVFGDTVEIMASGGKQ